VRRSGVRTNPLCADGFSGSGSTMLVDGDDATTQAEQME